MWLSFFFPIRLRLCCLKLIHLWVKERGSIHLLDDLVFPQILLGDLYYMSHLSHIALREWGTILPLVLSKRNLGIVNLLTFPNSPDKKQHCIHLNLFSLLHQNLFLHSDVFPYMRDYFISPSLWWQGLYNENFYLLGSCHIADHRMGLKSAFKSLYNSVVFYSVFLILLILNV